MATGIDLTPYALRISIDTASSVNSSSYYGIQGVVPQWNEPIVWTDSQVTRGSAPGSFISVMDAWCSFNQNYHSQIEYSKASDPDPISMTTAEVVIASIKAHMASNSEEFTTVAVDNTMPEFQQSALLKTMGQSGFGRRELLWRPIALALDHLCQSPGVKYGEGDKLIIADIDAYIPEIIILELKEHRGHLIPLRSLPKVKRESQDQPWVGMSINNLIQQFLGQLSGDDSELFNQLISGPFTKNILQYLDEGKSDDIWIRRGLDHEKLNTNSKWLNELGSFEIEGEDFQSIRERLIKEAMDAGAKTIIWNGLLPRRNEHILGTDEKLMDQHAIARGAAEYGARRLKGIPGYLDTLPGLEILSRDEKAGSHKFYPVIPPDVVEGGQKVRIPEPLTHFSLESGTTTFTSVLHNIAEDYYKKLITDLPEIAYSGHIPVILKAEAVPGQGHALVTIEGAPGNEDIFGPSRVLALDWNSMEDFEFETYSGPEVYPVRGRIADDPHSLAIAREFATGKYHIGSSFDYPCGRVGYMRIHEPWGYENPCKQPLRQPMRALFGAMEEDDPEIQNLADAIGQHIISTVTSAQNRHKYLNYMFRYAPEVFREELREIYRSENPTLNWNTIYAVGRTFFRRTDYEIFLDFLLRKSTHAGYPSNYTSDEIAAMYWSFFRCLCYYEDAAYASCEKVMGVLETIYNYSVYCAQNGWPGGNRSNVIKYLLSGILFSLRLRRPCRGFLAKESEQYRKMASVIQDLMPRIPYPPAMFATQRSDYLNDFVFRFLAEESTEQDLGALQGLVVSMA